MEQRKKTGTAVSKSEDYAVRIICVSTFVMKKKNMFFQSSFFAAAALVPMLPKHSVHRAAQTSYLK